MNMLNINNIAFERSDRLLFSNVSFTLEQGQLLHLEGANGVGKSTLLKIIALLLHPSEGSISYCGSEVNLDPDAYKKQCHYMGHVPGINRYLTVEEYGRLYLGEKDIKTNEYVAALQLKQLIHRQCGTLSAGQKQKLALLRLALHAKSIWLLDEPWNVLDIKGREILDDMIKNHVRSGGIVLAVSHHSLQHVGVERVTYQL